MSDTGDKILSLTRQILQNSTITLPQTAPTSQTNTNDVMNNVKAVCLAALVAATGTAVVSHLAYDLNRPVNRYEETEIKALVFYASQRLGDSETAITLRLMDDLGLVHTDNMTTADYRRIREYMWTLLMRAA